MSNKEKIHPLNVNGRYFCTFPDGVNDDGCISCGLCPSSLPEVFAEDEDGLAYVYKQPGDELEFIVEELIRDCPVESIGKTEMDS